MISEPAAFQASTPSMGTGAWRTPIGQRHLAGVGAMARRLSSALSSWACAPIEPYAALREASTLLGADERTDEDIRSRSLFHRGVLPDGYVAAPGTGAIHVQLCADRNACGTSNGCQTAFDGFCRVEGN
jgi:hypothetical protein